MQRACELCRHFLMHPGVADAARAERLGLCLLTVRGVPAPHATDVSFRLAVASRRDPRSCGERGRFFEERREGAGPSDALD